MFRFHFMDNFVNTRKNFPDSQQLSGRHCRRADEVFGTLVHMYVSLNIKFGKKTCSQKGNLYGKHLVESLCRERCSCEQDAIEHLEMILFSW